MGVTRYYWVDSPSAPLTTVNRAGAWSAINPSPTTPRLVTANRPGTGTTAQGATVQETLSGGAQLMAMQTVGFGLGLSDPTTFVGTFRVAVKMAENQTGADAYLRCILRAVSADGLTVRGTLFDGVSSTEVPVSSAVAILSGSLTPVLVQPSDRLVWEIGADLRNTNSLASGITLAGHAFTNPDLPFTAGSTATGVSWLELTLTDPPAAAPVVTVGGADTDTLVVDWTAVPDATGYQVRLDGGAWVDATTSFGWTFDGLAPGTSYTVGVRAYNAAGFGPIGTVTGSTLGPPTAAPVLTVAGTSTDAIVIDWTTVPDATGYQVRLDAGAWVDATGFTGWTFSPVEADTDYTVAVRATNTAGAGPADTELVHTPAPVAGYYRATVWLGTHTWSAERGQDAALGPILPLELGWQIPDDAPGLPAQPDPDTCVLSLVTATALADVATGTPARVTVWLDPAPGARPYVTMAGEVGDLEASPYSLPDGTPGVLTRMLLVGHETHPNAYTVGAGVWPAESGAARAARIMAEAGELAWSTSSPVGNTFAERAARTSPKAVALTEALAEAAVYTAGRYGAPGRHLWRALANAYGVLEGYTADLVPAQTDAVDVIDGAWVNRATSWRRTRRRDGSWVQVTYPGGVRVYGRPEGPPLPPAEVQVTDPDPYADLLLSTLSDQAWVSGEWFRVHLHAGAPARYGRDWFRRDDLSPGFPFANRAVVVDNIQVMPGLFTRYGGMLAAARLVIEPGGRVVLLFRLRPDVPAFSTVTPRWVDENDTDTWADEPPGATWADLRTTPRED